MIDVVQRLLATVRKRGVKIKFLLLDKGFFSVEVIAEPQLSKHSIGLSLGNEVGSLRVLASAIYYHGGRIVGVGSFSGVRSA
jgi:hypothetical protein